MTLEMYFLYNEYTNQNLLKLVYEIQSTYNQTNYNLSF